MSMRECKYLILVKRKARPMAKSPKFFAFED